MSDQQEHPEPVAVGDYPSEVEASLVVQELERAGVKAWTTGELTSGMRAEAPGSVRVWVRAPDADAARAALRRSGRGG